MERNPVLFLGRRSAELLRAARERWPASWARQADDLVFVPNATTGVNIVARSLATAAGRRGAGHRPGIRRLRRHLAAPVRAGTAPLVPASHGAAAAEREGFVVEPW
jgi:hypothetical protein